MQKITVLIIPDKSKQTKSIVIPIVLIKSVAFGCLFFMAFLGFLTLDYTQLLRIREQHFKLVAENQHLKGEAQILMKHLGEVKESLKKVGDYTIKLNELVNFRVDKVSEETGLSQISSDDFATYPANKSMDIKNSDPKVPLGINIDNLILRPAFEELASVGYQANKQGVELQELLSTMSQKKSLLSSIPSLSPVRGWITSNFGHRLDPFNGEGDVHMGIDIAAPVGTPVMAPADGVILFAGAKPGFGNFIILAHYGSGIITRYGHNSENMVHAGQKISRGEQIGAVGMTGRTTGPHLHYEVWVNGKAVNPRKFILDTPLEFALN